MSKITSLTGFKARKAAAAAPAQPLRVYESAADTAKKIREALKAAFPGIKFSVQSKTYSMGSSVNVHWTDGPSWTAVDALLERFRSRDNQVPFGYAWEGLLIVGAKHIDGGRTVSDGRRQELIAVLEMHGIGPYDRWGYTNPQFEQAELLLAEQQAQIAAL